MKVAQWHPTVFNPIGYIVCGILQARTLELAAFPSPGDLPNPEIKLRSYALQVDSLPLEPQGSLNVHESMQTRKNSDYSKQVHVKSEHPKSIKNLPKIQEMGGSNSWCRKIPWRREWQPPAAFLPTESQDRAAWQATSPWSHKSPQNLATKTAAARAV